MTRKATDVRVIITTFAIIFAILLIRTAWINDDAYITLRTVDNFVHGYGLTWNVVERVQAFTDPLWMFLLSACYFLSREGYFTTLGLSIIVSIATVILFGIAVSKNSVSLAIGMTILVLSKAFVEYSTSGLENPLTHLLLISFIFLYFQSIDNITAKKLFWLGLIAALAAANRMDTILFYIPALIYAAIRLHKRKAVLIILATLIPFIAWEIFSFLYYGFLVPNSAYAKLNTGIALKNLLEQGVLYFMNGIDWDPLTLGVIGLGVLLSIWRSSFAERVIAIGILLYLLYIVWIGGDFMSGRFFSAPLLAGAVLLARQLDGKRLIITGIVYVMVIILGFAAVRPAFLSSDTYGGVYINPNGIADERAFYYQASGLLIAQRNHRLPAHAWVDIGNKLRANSTAVYTTETIGYMGYFAGPKVYLVDIYALSNPLLSRLPVTNKIDWRIGHFHRTLPDGYLESLKTGINVIKDPDLAHYYDKLLLITRGPIWNWKRFVTIWNMNLGHYDYLIQRYLQRQGQ